MSNTDLNFAIAQTVKAELVTRGITVAEAAAQIDGMSERTLFRLVDLEPPVDRKPPQWNAHYIEGIARVLGLPVSHLMAEAERRAGTGSAAPPTGGDPRALISWLLDNPGRDEELNTRLSESELQTGLTGRRLVTLQETIRTVRREELINALDALPPSAADRADRQSG